MKKTNVTRKELAVSVNEQLGIPQRNTATIIDIVFTALKRTLINGESIKLVQFGSFIVRKILPSPGRNPRTGESMMIFERQMITFRPSRQLRENMNV